MEIYPQCHIIESSYQNRRISSCILGGRHYLLVDSGFAFTPKEVILPYLDKHGLDGQEIDWLVVTHASADHFGGNHSIKCHYPGIKIIAHRADANAIADRQVFLQEHKLWSIEYGFQHQSITTADFDRLFGIPTLVDLDFTNGVRIRLDEEWYVELLPAPGHTPGHCIIYDPKNEAVIGGDAVLGMGVPDLDGKLIMPPHYFEVHWYTETIQKIIDLKPKYLLLTHYPPLSGAEVKKFLGQSQDFVLKCKNILEAMFEANDNRINSSKLIHEFRSKIGIPQAENQYQLLLRAHLNHLQNRDKLSYITENSQKTWIYTNRSDKHSGQGRSKTAM